MNLFSGTFPRLSNHARCINFRVMAQTAACLVSYEDQSLSLNNPAGIEKAKFRKPVIPKMNYLKINLISNKRSLYKFNGKAFVQNNLVASSDFSAMLVNQEKVK